MTCVVKFDYIHCSESSSSAMTRQTRLAEEIWVLHAFQKKSTQRIKTPHDEVELIESRFKTLKELLG